MKVLRFLLLAACAVLLVACGSPEERAAGHIEKAREFFEQEDYVKAKLEAQNAGQIQPKNAEARFLLAEIEEKEGNFRAAVGHLLVAVDANPNMVEARTRLGLYYFLGRAEEQAAEQAAAAMEIAPEDPTVRLLNARVKYLQGDTDAAVAEAQYALELDPANPDAVMFLSGITAEAGDTDEAFAILDAGIERVPVEKNQPLRQFRLQLLARTGRFDEVEAGLEALASDYPDEEVYKYALAQFYAQQDKPDKAIEMLQQVVALDPEDADRKINLVRLLVNQQRTEQAEETLKQFIDEQPQEHQLGLALASLYESQQRMDEARVTYEDVAAADPLGEQGLQARNRLTVMDIRDNNLDDARARVESTLTDAPDNPDALIMRAAFEFADGDNDAAISDLRVALRRDEGSERALLLLARAYVRKGDGVLAQDAYRRLLAINPKHPLAPRELAALLANQGDTAEAQEVLQARLDVDPQDTVAASGLIQTMLAQRDLEGAEAEARRLVDLNQDNALAQLQLGRVLQAKGSTEESIAAYKATLEENPKATLALQGLVGVLTLNGRADEAAAYLQDYLAEFPDSLEARLLLGAVYAEQQKTDLANQEFEAVIQAQPKAIRAYVAQAALAPNNSAEREAIYRRGLEAMPGNPQLSLLLASQYERQQRMDDAMQVYETLLETSPENLIAINNLAALLLDFRDDEASYQRALELARKLESTDQPALLDTVGWAYYRTGDYARAVRYTERAVAGAGQVPVLRYHLGMAYAANNNPVGAKQELSEALANPDTNFTGIEDARAKLAELEAS